MTALPLAQVCDTDCVASTRPLVLRRMPGRYVYGVQAVLRRVLYGWLLPTGVLAYDPTFGDNVLLLPGSTLGDRELLGLRQRLEKRAKAEDYVRDASVPLTMADTTLTVAGAIKLIDGRTYPLELLLSQAGAALDALGV